ncbi:MAG TPA: hypothetical protein VIO94_06420 [Phenylobacterium sp.]
MRRLILTLGGGALLCTGAYLSFDQNLAAVSFAWRAAVFVVCFSVGAFLTNQLIDRLQK